MAALPIEPVLPAVVGALADRRVVVLEAPPGAGKTTRVPRALDDAGLLDAREEILVVEPRRLAARLAARRVASERGERVGARVGYRVRFEDAVSDATRVVFVTEGVLLRRLADDPALRGVGAVIFDEFHERHLQADLALALCRRLAATRPLRLAVMSATLDAAPIARWLDAAPIVRAEGRQFEVTVEHLAQQPAADRPLELEVAQAVRRLVADGLDGDVLVFLPGAAEIRRAQGALAELAARNGIDVTMLHGDLSPDEQDRAITPGPRPKIILSTNVAESSVTVEGVVAVVDSGLHRAASTSPWSGLPTLRVEKISRASAAQRAGRAGRLRPGRCLRLYTRHDHDGRPSLDVPEVRRADLAETVLLLASLGERDAAAFPWFEPPTAAGIEAARRLLARLGAVDDAGAITERGRRMLALPVHPRQARVVLEGAARGVAGDAAGVAAILGEGGVKRRMGAGVGAGRGRGPRQGGDVGHGDVFEELALLDEAARGGLRADRAASLGLDVGAAFAADRVRRDLLRRIGHGHGHGHGSDDLLAMCVLAGYPDRVARRRKVGGDELVLSSGGSAQLHPSSVVADAELLVAVEAEVRGAGGGRTGGVVIRSAVAIEPEQLVEIAPESVSERTTFVLEGDSGRLTRVTQTLYDELVLEESRRPAGAPSAEPDPALRRAMGAAFVEAARAKGGLAGLVDAEALEQLFARVDFLRAHGHDDLPALGPADVDAALADAFAEARTLSDVDTATVMAALEARLDGGQRARLGRLAPERVTLPGGRAVKIRWERTGAAGSAGAGVIPSIASRLQDFFGLRRGPAVLDGKVPLALHLLAPNQRAVQVTTDLAGFWERHYPSIRKELCRRYPRHAWPDDPLTAAPPQPKHR